MLKQWPNAAIQFVPIVNQLGKDGRESYTRSISEVSQLSDSLSKISVALEMAEGARIEKGVGDGSIGIHKSKDFTLCHRLHEIQACVYKLIHTILN
jgi:hypothetical protein